MVIVADIIKTKSQKLYDECFCCSHVLYVNCGSKIKHLTGDFYEFISHFDELEPVAYSSNYNELEKYAKNNNLANFIIKENSLMKN